MNSTKLTNEKTNKDNQNKHEHEWIKTNMNKTNKQT